MTPQDLPLSYWLLVLGVLAASVLWGAFLGPWLRVVDGDEHLGNANAHNGMFQACIRREVAADQFWLGIVAQEVYEFRYKWARLHFPIVFSAGLRQELELRGHAVECAAYELFDNRPWSQVQDYMMREAHALQGYPQFVGCGTTQLVAEMKARMGLARAWVAKNEAYLRRQAAKR